MGMTGNSGWDLSTIPTEAELADWHGVKLGEGWEIELDLRVNNLSGSLPPEFEYLTQLESLRLVSNNLTWPIPPELRNLTRLKNLDLRYNDFSGRIPPELGSTLHQLKTLSLSGNSLSGPIPPELSNLTQLRHLNLSNNDLPGPIPPELGGLTQLRSLDLGLNSSLSGPIPPEIGDLAQLDDLDLGWTSLKGWVPPELGNLSELQSLHLQGWLLTGMLPRDLMKLDNLRTLVFKNQELCAPPDAEFQTWLSGITHVDGPTCTGVQFAVPIADQSFLRGQPITPLVLPAAVVGVAPFNYALTPAMPAGLSFDQSTRTISGTPTEVALGKDYEYKATDAHGSEYSLRFNLEVFSATPISFDASVPDLSFPRGFPAGPVVLPEATGGKRPIRYTLAPALPAGLSFDVSASTIGGTPTELTVTPVQMTYTGTDANGFADSLQFTVEVYQGTPVSFEYTVPDLSFSRGSPVAPVVLPEASGGVPPLSYSLAPTLPTGLRFNAT